MGAMAKRPYYDPRIAPSEEAIEYLIALRSARNSSSVPEPVPLELTFQLTNFGLARIDYAQDKTRERRKELADLGIRTLDLEITESGLNYIAGLSR
jgi:hypothetical protein